MGRGLSLRFVVPQGRQQQSKHTSTQKPNKTAEGLSLNLSLVLANTMTSNALRAVVGRGLREAGAALKEGSELMEVRKHNIVQHYYKGLWSIECRLARGT